MVRAGQVFPALARLAIFCYQITIMASIPDNRKSRGRPKTGIGKPVGLRLYPDLEKGLGAWIADQATPKPNVPEAIRRILTDYLKRRGFIGKGE